MIVRRFPRKYLNDHKKVIRPGWTPNTIHVGPALHNPVREIYRGLRNGGMGTMEARNHLYTLLYHVVTYTPRIELPRFYEVADRA